MIGKSYSILGIDVEGVFNLYSSITINSTSGSISTTSGTNPGTYNIYVRNTGSYNITTYNLIVNTNNQNNNIIQTNFVNGNQYFTRIRNISSTDIQRLNSDEIFLNKLRVTMYTEDPSTNFGIIGDVIFWWNGTNVYLSVCAESGNTNSAIWQSVQLS